MAQQVAAAALNDSIQRLEEVNHKLQEDNRQLRRSLAEIAQPTSPGGCEWPATECGPAQPACGTPTLAIPFRHTQRA